MIAGLHILQLDRKTAPLGPAVVHAEEHVGPVIRLGAACARLDGEDGVVPVELAGEERGDFERIEFLHHRGHLAVQLARVCFPLGAVRQLHQLQHHADVVDPFLEGDDGQHGLFQAVELGDVLLGAIGVAPKGRRAHLGLHRLDFPLLLIAVKETSRDGRRAS